MLHTLVLHTLTETLSFPTIHVCVTGKESGSVKAGPKHYSLPRRIRHLDCTRRQAQAVLVSAIAWTWRLAQSRPDVLPRWHFRNFFEYFTLHVLLTLRRENLDQALDEADSCGFAELADVKL